MRSFRPVSEWHGVVFSKAFLGISQHHDRRTDDRPPSLALKISLDGDRYRTVDWSLSGVLVADYYGARAPGDEVEGCLQIVTDMNSYPFKAVVVRRDSTVGQLALNFTDLGPRAFSVLEAFMMGRYGI